MLMQLAKQMFRVTGPKQVLDPDTAIVDVDAPLARSSSAQPASAPQRESRRTQRAARPDDEATPRRGTRRSGGSGQPGGSGGGKGGGKGADSSRFGSVLSGVARSSQARILMPVMVAAAIGALLLLWLDSRHADDTTTVSRLVGDALTHSQRAARAAGVASTGVDEGFVQMRDSTESLRSAMGALATGQDPATGRSLMLADDLREPIAAAQTPWKVVEASAAMLSERQQPLKALAAARKALGEGAPLTEQAQTVLAVRVQSGASGRDVAAAAELAVTAQRLSANLVRVMAGPAEPALGSALAADAVRLPELVDGLLSGSERLRISPVGEPDARRALGELKRLWAGAAPALADALKDPDRLVQARRAGLTLVEQSEPLGRALGDVQSILRVSGGGSPWNAIGAAACAIVALICGLLIGRTYLAENRRRADEAEQQRRVAERLEQEAKRTNDQNQAAILRLMNELQEVADGDLTVQATVSEDITGAIADSVNYTVEELRNLVSRINATAELVNEASGKAQMTASSLQAASDQQSREIRETGESVLRMAQQIHEVSARASESVDVARQSLAASQEGARAVQNAIAGMNGIRDQIQETAKRIKRLGESSQEIGEIVELISDITEQTNVLALNAAIQAASAGEAGRGFTVVAEEVQRLAERSAEATKQIAALIRAIQTDTQDAVAAMERSTQGVVEGTRLSDEAGRALGDIGRVSTQLAELIEDFSSTTSKQAASAGTLAQSIQRILLVTEQTSEGTLQTAGSIRQVSELAQELKSSVSRFKVS